MSGFLSPADLERLTGYKPNQLKRQCGFLKDSSIPYRVNAKGEAVVCWSDIEGRKQAQESAPKLSVFA